ncbi:MAG: cysteine hydrolase [Thermodesulfobacteriota bacterium]
MKYVLCRDLDLLSQILPPAQSALLVVDMQNDFCSPQGRLAATGGSVAMIQEMIPRLSFFLVRAREMGVRIIYLRHINSPEAMSEAWLSREVLSGRNKVNLAEPETWGSEIIAELTPGPGDLIVLKHRYSGFVQTRLDLVLRAKKIKGVVVTGVSTNVCVDSTARDAFMRDYFVVLPEDGVASTVRELHLPALVNLARYFGRVTRFEFILAAWEKAAWPAEVDR